MTEDKIYIYIIYIKNIYKLYSSESEVLGTQSCPTPRPHEL